jgi:tetratricopeptide (TPR) repeat protein
MTFAEKASLTVGIFTAVASWLAVPGFQPAFDRAHRAVAALVLALVAAVGVSLAIATFEPTRARVPDPPVTVPSDTVAAPSTTSIAVYKAPPEPAAASTTTGTTTTAPTMTSPPPVPPSPAPEERERPGAAIERQRRQALSFTNARDWPQAAAAWRTFIDTYAGHDRAADHAAYYNLGVAYDALHDWSAAADAFERAKLADIGRNDTQNLLHLGRCYAKLGRWSESVAAYEEVLKIEPSNALAQKSLFWALKQQPRSE